MSSSTPVSNPSVSEEVHTVGSVLDTCLSALQTLSGADKERVVLSLLTMHPPRGFKKLGAILTPGGGSNATNPPQASVASAKAASKKEIPSKKAAEAKKKQAPPAAKAWAKNPVYLDLKKIQADAAAAVAAQKRSSGAQLLPDDPLIVALNSARTAVQNFRP
jgi:hypothetical protein